MGYHYNVPSWNARYKNAPRNLYPRFIHKDRSLKSCYINSDIKPRDSPFHVANEFNRIKRQVTSFQYNPEEIEISDVTKRIKNNKAIDVIIFSVKRTTLT